MRQQSPAAGGYKPIIGLNKLNKRDREQNTEDTIRLTNSDPKSIPSEPPTQSIGTPFSDKANRSDATTKLQHWTACYAKYVSSRQQEEGGVSHLSLNIDNYSYFALSGSAEAEALLSTMGKYDYITKLYCERWKKMLTLQCSTAKDGKICLRYQASYISESVAA